ncbi:hypothetical protein A3K63_03135 [Candidatus Micrarchaeota archaeon RBG_16_49_10]|nr:MAG: hypothetical protein A3K63_03135 [Candidatus Micrarchaeota archaeon RBG_16_49_10]
MAGTTTWYKFDFLRGRKMGSTFMVWAFDALNGEVPEEQEYNLVYTEATYRNIRLLVGLVSWPDVFSNIRILKSGQSYEYKQEPGPVAQPE